MNECLCTRAFVDFLTHCSFSGHSEEGLPHWGHGETLSFHLYVCLKDQGGEREQGRCQWEPCERLYQKTDQKVYIENDSLFYSKPGSTGGQ